MEIAGYFGALMMGLTLGLIGGGGSILTIPILVYLFGLDAVTATAYSLFIVGTTALFGGLSHVRHGNVHGSAVLIFGVPSIVAIFLTRSLIMPALPSVWCSLGPLVVTKSIGLLLLFALLMVAAAIRMIRKSSPSRPVPTNMHSIAMVMLAGQGILIGTLAGLVGAGGGFLIIPALVHFGGLGMKQAIGSSLIIIATNGLVGFTGDLLGGQAMNWPFLLAFTSIAIGGILAGSALSKRLGNEHLRPAFGWFVLGMGILMIVKELAGA